MKYILMCIAALVVCLGLGYVIIRIFCKKRTGKVRTAILSLLSGLALMLILSLIYMCIYGHAEDKAADAMKGNEEVAVSEIDGGWFFDGPSDERAIVFYQGAKVESIAYAPLMVKLAENGFDCFLADMPFNFAIFKGDAADTFVRSYSYDMWLMAGHSMGGIMASRYAQNNLDSISGVILLASYSDVKLDDRLALCSIYGSSDGCLDREEYDRCKNNWPVNSSELVIDGGNHSQFGDYGLQKGDGRASLSEEKQLEETADFISEVYSR